MWSDAFESFGDFLMATFDNTKKKNSSAQNVQLESLAVENALVKIF